LQDLQSEFGDDDLVVLYYHLSDAFAIPEGGDRADIFEVSGIPEVDFDAVTEVIGAGSSVYNTYLPIVQTRLAVDSQVTIDATGIVFPATEPDSSWVTATFKAADTVTHGDMTAQFVVYEWLSDAYPWSVRDMLTTEVISTLASPGDSVVVTRKFVADTTWNTSNVRVAIFLEDESPREVVNAKLMPRPFSNRFRDTDMTAAEINYSGEAIYHTVLENTGVMRDTIAMDIVHEILPDGLGEWDWVKYFCDPTGACHFGPTEYVLEPGEAETFDVHLMDTVGHTEGMSLITLSAVSTSDPNMASSVSFATFVEAPSILLVDDDDNKDYETYLMTALGDTGYTARIWDTSDKGRPTITELASYWAVFWTTANADAAYFTVDDENVMQQYLDGGGNLMFASTEYLSSRQDTSDFMSDYLKITSWTNDTSGFIVSGVAGDDITDGLTLGLFSGPFATNYSDSFVLGPGADQIFTSPVGVKGLKTTEADYKLVFLSFAFELIDVDDPDPNNQASFVARVIDWFKVPVGTGVEDGTVERLALRQNHPNPFNPVTRLAFTVPGGAESVTLKIHNVNGQVVRTLIDGPLPPGPAEAVWDGRGDDGSRLASGIYFARIEAGEESAVRKMTLLK
jgi:hypothetical protein